MKNILVDKRNFSTVASEIIDAIKASSFTGLDCETEDSRRHEGLNLYCKYDDDGFKSKASKLVFDMRRTTMCGFSLYPEGHDTTYYVNLNHADIENRLPWHEAKTLLDTLPNEANFIAHNAPFEITAFGSCYAYPLPRIICSLQMAVSAYGPDEYSTLNLQAAPLGAMVPVLQKIKMASVEGWYPETREMNPELSDLVYKIIAKESDSAHSYNGFVKSIAYGYGLKQAVKSFFDHEMTTFEKVLGGRPHMGHLTGQDVVDYGCEDAYWAVRLFRHLMAYMAQNCPDAIDAFFTQENPMCQVYSDMWRGGMRVNAEAIHSRRDLERQEMAKVLREMKAVVKKLLPFPDLPHEKLMEVDTSWYPKNWKKYRKQVVDWATAPDHDDDFTQCHQVRGPVSNAWAKERGKLESKGINLAHYMPVRTLIYDLLSQKTIMLEGKTQSDGEARGKLKLRLEKQGHTLGVELLDCLTKIASIEQRIKLYITPYLYLTDPETDRMYPTVSSMLATRRMAASSPNPMQLAKRGTSTYVRGFFLPDEDDHVIVSIDWSGIELVEIGEFSGDPEFIKAFGQTPHADLHAGAAADILSVEVPGLTEEKFKQLQTVNSFDELGLEDTSRLSTNLKGETIGPKDAYKYWRTEVGKGANFNYWYSGWLSTIGERMGWSPEKTADATERYKQRFAVAEAWRLNTIQNGQIDGYVKLPDGHRRVRFEAQAQWRHLFLTKLLAIDPHNTCDNYRAVCEWMCSKIQKRAQNQLVNAYIQGSCATIAKRSVISQINQLVKEARLRCRFLMPIHDELLWSVHRDDALTFIRKGREIMISHPDIFKKCQLDASPAVGLTFEPWHKDKAPLGQIELFEAPELPGVLDPATKGKRLSNDDVQRVIDYLFETRDGVRKAA